MELLLFFASNLFLQGIRRSCIHSCHRVFNLVIDREIWVAGVLQPSCLSCHRVKLQCTNYLKH